MTLAEQQTHDLLGAIDDAPEDLTWNNVDFTGTRGGLVRTSSNQEGGLLVEPEMSWSTTLQKLDDSGALTDRFPGYATVNELVDAIDGETVTVDGRLLQVDKVAVDEFEVAMQLDLMSPHKEGR